MIRRMLTLVVAALFMLALAAPAFAISPSEQACLDAGGQFDRIQGQVICVVTETGKNPKFTDTNATTGQGNTGNKTETSDVCGGTGSGKCPPGQF